MNATPPAPEVSAASLATGPSWCHGGVPPPCAGVARWQGAAPRVVGNLAPEGRCSRWSPEGRCGSSGPDDHDTRRAVIAAATLAAAVAVLAGLCPARACGDFAGALDAAVGRDPQRAVVDAGYAYAQEVGRDADRWTSGNPTLYGSWISDEPTDSVGLREYEGGVNLPLRTPAERRALHDEEAAAQRIAALTAATRRLEVAGLVREAFWAARLAAAGLEEAEHEVEHLAMLDDFLARRVARGDAAPLDRDLTALELAGVRADLAMARGEHAAALHRWQVLTGCERLPAALAEPVPPAEEALDPLDHPALALAAAQREQATARLDAEAARPGQPPTLGFMMRRERGAVDAPFIDSVGVNLTIPIGRSGYRIRARADAAQALAGARAEAVRLARELSRDRANARSRLQAARAAAEAADARLTHAESALVRAEAAHEANAWSTSDLLRVRARTAEARLEAARAHARLGRARSRVNHYAGVLPP